MVRAGLEGAAVGTDSAFAEMAAVGGELRGAPSVLTSLGTFAVSEFVESWALVLGLFSSE